REWEALRRLKCAVLHAVKTLRPVAVLIEHVGRKRRAEVLGGGASGGRRGRILVGRLVDPGFVLVLLGLLGVVYAPSLDDTPRAYQGDSLLDSMGRDTSLDDGSAPSGSEQRTRHAGPGDTELFRPVLFDVAAVEDALFGTHFMLYQAFGILLHWGV